MSFSIFAAGTRGRGRRVFNYSKDNCLDSGDFDSPAVLSMIPSSPTAAGVIENMVGSPDSHIDGAVRAGISRIAEMQFVHMIVTGVTLLAMNARGGIITVSCRESNMFWVDTSSYAAYHISRSNPGRGFLREILPGLKSTDLNNFGVLGQIAIVISQYDSALPNSVRPHLNIQISH